MISNLEILENQKPKEIVIETLGKQLLGAALEFVAKVLIISGTSPDLVQNQIKSLESCGLINSLVSDVSKLLNESASAADSSLNTLPKSIECSSLTSSFDPHSLKSSFDSASLKSSIDSTSLKSSIDSSFKSSNSQYPTPHPSPSESVCSASFSITPLSLTPTLSSSSTPSTITSPLPSPCASPILSSKSKTIIPTLNLNKLNSTSTSTTKLSHTFDSNTLKTTKNVINNNKSNNKQSITQKLKSQFKHNNNSDNKNNNNIDSKNKTTTTTTPFENNIKNSTKQIKPKAQEQLKTNFKNKISLFDENWREKLEILLSERFGHGIKESDRFDSILLCFCFVHAKLIKYIIEVYSEYYKNLNKPIKVSDVLDITQAWRIREFNRSEYEKIFEDADDSYQSEFGTITNQEIHFILKKFNFEKNVLQYIKTGMSKSI